MLLCVRCYTAPTITLRVVFRLLQTTLSLCVINTTWFQDYAEYYYVTVSFLFTSHYSLNFHYTHNTDCNHCTHISNFHGSSSAHTTPHPLFSRCSLWLVGHQCLKLILYGNEGAFVGETLQVAPHVGEVTPGGACQQVLGHAVYSFYHQLHKLWPTGQRSTHTHTCITRECDSQEMKDSQYPFHNTRGLIYSALYLYDLTECEVVV